MNIGCQEIINNMAATIAIGIPCSES